MDNNTEMVTPLYWNREVMEKPPIPLYRTHSGGDRYYYNVDEQGNFIHFPSVTTILGNTMPQNEYLIKWISQYGYEKAMEKRDQMADYGTLLHICIAQFLIHGVFDYDTLSVRIECFKYEHHIRYNTHFWRESLAKDIKAFEAFAAEFQVKPIAIELMLTSLKLGFAGAIDMVIEMTVGTGKNFKILQTDVIYSDNGEILVDKRRKIVVVLDVKSGKKGFYPTHEAQLHMYNEMWVEHYPFLLPEALLNWSPKDWDDEPDYNLKDQSESMQRFCIKNYVEIFNSLNNWRDKKYYYISGNAVLGQLDTKGIEIETFSARVRRLKGMQQEEAAPEPEPKQTVLRPMERKSKRKQKEVIPEESKQILNQVFDSIPEETVPGTMEDILSNSDITATVEKTPVSQTLTDIFNTIKE